MQHENMGTEAARNESRPLINGKGNQTSVVSAGVDENAGLVIEKP
jgi:hypothetical protein